MPCRLNQFVGVSAWVRDVHYGARQLRRSPTFTIVALLTLGLGLGINTAIFSVAHAVALRPLPFADADRLVELRGDRINPPTSSTTFLSTAQRDDALRGSPSLGSFASHSPIVATVTGQGEAENVTGLQVSADFFDTYGVRALLGRTIVAADTLSKQPQVVVISHALWQRRFGEDLAVVGKNAYLAAQPANLFTPFVPSGRPFEIIGVMPPERQFPIEGDIWLPLPDGAYTSAMGLSPREVRPIVTVARLVPGGDLANANTELQEVARQLEARYPDTDAGWRLRAIPLKEATAGELGRALLLLLGAVSIVVLLACVGISSLMVARNTARQQEIAIRETLGASRGALVRLFLAETILLAVLAGAAGVIFANCTLTTLCPSSSR